MLHYPDFNKIDLSLRDEVQNLTDKFEPYSDFNFTSLFCWNHNNDTKLCTLNDNLVILLPDYVDGSKVVSFIGNNMIEATIDKLLDKYGQLSLVPELVIDVIKTNPKYVIHEERAQFDYIYELEGHAFLRSGVFKNKRKKLHRFTSNYGDRVSFFNIDFTNREHLGYIRQVFDFWVSHDKKSDEDVLMEGSAIKRVIKYGHDLNLNGILIFIDKKVCGFSIFEILNKKTAIYHFQKALYKVDNIDLYLTNETSKYLHEKGCEIINWEQDLGIEGLKATKLSYHPIQYLKKYSVKLKGS